MINPLLKKKKKKEEPKTNNFNEMISPENNQDPFLKFGKSENPPIMTPTTPTKTDKEKAFWSTPTNEKIKAGDNTIQNQFDIQNAKNRGMGGAEALQNQQEAQRIQQRNAQLLALGQQGLLSPEEIQSVGGAELDLGQAVGAGLSGVLPGLIGGAVGGATIGAVGGAGVGAIPGAVIGGVGGALTGFLVSTRSNIKSQQTGEFAADQTALTKGDRYLRSLITDTNQNPTHAPENIALFYQTLNNIDAAHAKTYRDSQENLNKWLGNDGTPQLAKFEVFDQTMRQYYISQFEASLIQPDPTRILIASEELGLELEE